MDIGIRDTGTPGMGQADRRETLSSDSEGDDADSYLVRTEHPPWGPAGHLNRFVKI